MPQPQAKIGVIGGSGLYDIEGMTGIKQVDVSTPFGKPSDSITVGRLGGVGIAFLPRHGKGHRILPSEVPSRANIYALKSLGVEHIIAVCSAGSFKKEIEPGHLLIPDQLIDRTKGRPGTFFGEGIVAHVPFADPFCPELSEILYDSATAVGATVHPKGTFVVMEGPAFSTRAESRLYRSWGADVIGMTNLTEAKLAREAEVCYASLGLVTDYDAWRETGEPVGVDTIVAVLRDNTAAARQALRDAVRRIDPARTCGCRQAMKFSILTDRAAIADSARRRLKPILGRYL